MIGELAALNLAFCAEEPHSGLANDLWATLSRSVRLTSLISKRWGFFDNAGYLFRIKRITSKTQRGEHSDRILRVRRRCCRGHRHAHPPPLVPNDLRHA